MAASGWTGTTRDGWGLQFSVECYVNWHDNSTISVTVRGCCNCVNCWVEGSERDVYVWVDGHYFAFGVAGVYQDGFYDFGYQTQEWDVGYAAGQVNVSGYGVMNGTAMSGQVDFGSFSVGYGDTYQDAPAPSIQSIVATGADSCEIRWTNNYSDQCPVSSNVMQFKDETSYASGFVNNDSVENDSGYWDRSVLAAGNIVVARPQVTSVHGGTSVASTSAMFLSAPVAMSGLSIVPNGNFGATLTWTNNQAINDYKTFIYEGGLTYNSTEHSYSVPSGAKLLATVGPGVSTWGSTSLWSTSGGRTTKMFSVVQCSSFAAWTNTHKSDAAMSGFGYVDGLVRSAGIRSASLSNGASAPAVPTSVSASYVTSSGVVSNTQAVVTWACAASTTSAPRAGFKVMCNGSVVAVYQDTSGEAATWTETVTFASQLGKSYVLSVAAYGIGGTSSAKSASTMYGTLPVPTVASVTRGWSAANGYYLDAKASVTGASYSYSWQSRYEFSGDSAYTSVNKQEVLIKGSAYSFVSATLQWRLVPNISGVDVESHASAWVTGTVAAATNGVASVSALQQTDGSVSECVVTFPSALTSGSETAISYVVTVTSSDKSVAVPSPITVKATGASSYSTAFTWMNTHSITISVVAYLDGFNAKAATCSFTYVPQSLLPPTLLSVAATSGQDGYFTLKFSDAKYGSPFSSGSAYGYHYTVYVDDVAATVQTPLATAFEANGSHSYVFYCMSPKQTRITVTATDSAGTVSNQSTELLVEYDSTGNGIFVSDGFASINRCKIGYVKKACIRAVDSLVYVEDCHVTTTADKFYDVSDDTNTHVSEFNNEYGVG